jgi:hypothetical protein
MIPRACKRSQEEGLPCAAPLAFGTRTDTGLRWAGDIRMIVAEQWGAAHGLQRKDHDVAEL